MHRSWHSWHTWTCLITYGIIISFVMETTKLRWIQMVSILYECTFTYSQPLSVHMLHSISLKVLVNVFISLYSLYIYVFTFCTISIFTLSFFLSALSLFLSLTIAYEVSLQNTNVLQSPWKQWEQRGRQGTVREFLWCWHCYQMHSSLVCVCMCAHAWHMFRSVFLKSLVFTYVS